MNLLAGLCGLALLSSTCLPSVPTKTEASVGVDVSKETLQLDFCDLSLVDSLTMSYEKDTKKITDIGLRMQYRVPKSIYSTFLEEDSETIFGVGVFLVDKNLSIDSYQRRGVYENTTFEEYFKNELETKTFDYLKMGSEKYVFIGEDYKAIDSKYASYIQYSLLYQKMLGHEDSEVACFSFMESGGTLVVTSSEITSVRKVAEKYVRTGKTNENEDLSDEIIETLCLHFDLQRPWQQNFFQLLFSNPTNWQTPQWITAALALVFLLLIVWFFKGKK